MIVIHKPSIWSLFWILSFGLIHPVISQTTSNSIRITGSVRNDQEEIIQGAAILIKKSTTGTASDRSGNFLLQVPSLPTVLVISYIGYDSQEVEVKDTDAPVIVRLTQTKDPVLTKSEPSYQLLDQVDEAPQPISGREEWHKYIARNIMYPANDRKAGVQGVVVVAFNVGTDGKIKDVELLRGIGGECDQEVIRVISSAPDWIPAKQNGQPVQARMRVPILFRVDSDKPEDLSKRMKEKAIAEEYGKHFVVVGYSSSSSFK